MGGDLEGAMAQYREAIRLDPKYAMPHSGMADLLFFAGNTEGAIREYEEVIRLDPRESRGHNGLGIVLERRGDLDGAIKAYEGAVRADPNDGYAVRNLRRARARELLPRLPDVAAGRAEPKTPAEACDFARLCGQPFVMRYATAVRLYQMAFAADATLADNPGTGHRYSAVCYAIQAAAGKGEDATTLDAAKAKLRDQALAWLKADLALFTKQLQAANATDRAGVLRTLRHWQKDTDLAAIRDAAALAPLPAAELKAFTQLWADVAALLKQAEGRKQ